jgi:hypothetical protein
MRGLTEGCLIILDTPQKPCIVIGDFFPSWLLHVSEVGYRVDHVLVKKPSYVSCIHTICSAEVPVWSGGNLSLMVSRLSLTEDTVVCFVDGRITSGLLAVLLMVGIQDVISTQTPRRSCSGWNSIFVTVPHSEVGGVTTRVVTLWRHSRVSLEGLPHMLPITAKRDAATVLSHSTFGWYFPTRPLDTVVEPLRCFNLGSESHPYYHGYGWLPAILDQNLRVLTLVLNSTAHKG